jgi:hypothetical protein
MDKWADYLISAVKSGPSPKCIESVEVHQDIGCVVCETLIVKRSDLIANLKKGYTYTVIFKTAMGKWRKGNDVCLVNVNGKDYIKATVHDCTAGDNFEEVPEF